MPGGILKPKKEFISESFKKVNNLIKDKTVRYIKFFVCGTFESDT